MTIDEAVKEWKSKNRRMGCVSSTNWFCSRVKGFYPVRKTRFTSSGEVFEHVVATDGFVVIDFSPNHDNPTE